MIGTAISRGFISNSCSRNRSHGLRRLRDQHVGLMWHCGGHAFVSCRFCMRYTSKGFSGLSFPIVVASSSFSSSSSPISPQPSDIAKETVLAGRYEVKNVIGRGANGTTYRCEDTETGKDVAIKALTLRSLKDWKQLELFEREAQTLENLDFPCIPKYLGYFEEDTPTDKAFFLVQEIVAGVSLQDMVSNGWRADEAEIIRIAIELLRTLYYLGERRPPVVHRDIKPANIVVEGGKSGGKVYLVDFGGVQAFGMSTGESLPGSTIVGTFGFMAPEQFRGAAEPASDLYSLGATILFLISGKPPSAFPTIRMRLDLDSVSMSGRLRNVVEGLLEPVVEDRLRADQALKILTGKNQEMKSNIALSDYSTSRGRGIGGSAFRQKKLRGGFPETAIDIPSWKSQIPESVGISRKPAGSRIIVTSTGNRLIIEIPPAKFDSSAAMTGGFALAWNSFVAFWTISALAGGGILFALFSIPFWFAGIDLVKKSFGRQFIKEKLEIGSRKWSLQQKLARFAGGEAVWSDETGKKAEGKTRDLAGASMQVVAYVNGVPQSQLMLRQGVESFIFGESLDPLEQEWLVDVINKHLKALDEGDIEIIGNGQTTPMALPEGTNYSQANIVVADESDSLFPFDDEL